MTSQDKCLERLERFEIYIVEKSEIDVSHEHLTKFVWHIKNNSLNTFLLLSPEELVKPRRACWSDRPRFIEWMFKPHRAENQKIHDREMWASGEREKLAKEHRQRVAEDTTLRKVNPMTITIM
jgi:hypothetical protein